MKVSFDFYKSTDVTLYLKCKFENSTIDESLEMFLEIVTNLRFKFALKFDVSAGTDWECFDNHCEGTIFIERDENNLWGQQKEISDYLNYIIKS